jgi:hypothetical protein
MSLTPSAASPTPPRTAPVSPATRVRWLVLAMLFTVTTINYGDRATLSIAGADIRKAFDLSPMQTGYIFSAFALLSMLLLVGDIHRVELKKSLLPGAGPDNLCSRANHAAKGDHAHDPRHAVLGFPEHVSSGCRCTQAAHRVLESARQPDHN